MNREEALRHFERVKQEISEMPDWQRTLLQESLEPTVPTPRQAQPKRVGERPSATPQRETQGT